MKRCISFFCAFILVAGKAFVPVWGGGEPIRIVTLGDSITKGYREGVRPDETFSAYLEKSLNEQGFPVEVINVGVGGERTDQALQRLEKDVIAKKPLMVTIMYGTNDSYVDEGRKESRLSADEFERNLRTLVKRLRRAGILPILMTEPRLGREVRKNGLGEDPNLRLERFMQRCRNVARQMKVPLVDHFEKWSREATRGVDIGKWTTDQCHPTPYGHRLMAETMLPVIRSLLESKAPSSAGSSEPLRN